jgi:hypothetical protein
MLIDSGVERQISRRVREVGGLALLPGGRAMTKSRHWRPLAVGPQARPPLVLVEHHGPARRRSWRAYYSRNALRLRAYARRYYAQHREALLLRRKHRRLRQHRIRWPRRRLTAQDWAELRRHYQTVRAQRDSMTFRELAVRFVVSPFAIQRRSSKDGGWSLRATPERP